MSPATRAGMLARGGLVAHYNVPMDILDAITQISLLGVAVVNLVQILERRQP